MKKIYFLALILLVIFIIGISLLITTKEPERQELNGEYKEVIATLFWAGEGATDENGYISNHESAWQPNWEIDFGGLDDPNSRCGFHPCSFTPKENPFYFALPYNDLDNSGIRKESAKNIPWFQEEKDNKSVLKNKWIEVKNGKKICYAQWQDVGPFESDDFDYVFGDSEPKNQYGVKAGIDLSPATWDCLGMKTNTKVKWKFIDYPPIGPWTEIKTTSPVAF